MTRTYKTFKDIQKFTVFVFSRRVHHLKYFFMSILPVQMKEGESFSQNKLNQNELAIFHQVSEFNCYMWFIVYNVQLCVKTLDGVYLLMYGDI